MNKTHLISLSAACAVVVLASFMPWITFRATIDFGSAFQGQMESMRQFMEQQMTASGWNGNVSLMGITLPNWIVPIGAAAVAFLAWFRATGTWETPRGVGIAIAVLCMIHLGILLLVAVMNSDSTRLGFGSLLAALASGGMLALTIFGREEEEERWEPVRYSGSPTPNFGPRPGRVEPHMD